MKRINTTDLTTSEGINYNIYELETIKELQNVYADNEDVYYYKEYTFRVKRVKNNVNGNPLYKIQLSKNFEDATAYLKGLVHRCYPNKKYALIQSYNLSSDLSFIFNKLNNN